MEKSVPLQVPIAATSPRSSWRTQPAILKAILLLAVLGFLTMSNLRAGNGFQSTFGRHPSEKTEALVKAPASNPQRISNAYTPFNWATAKALPYLSYSPCYLEEELGPFQCARLELPMDYWNGSTDAKIGLAVIKKPAVVPVTDQRYGGAVLLNPGGPGGSGVGFLLRAAKSIRGTIDTVDDKDGLYYDLISFDPRGVGETEPPVRCSNSLQMDRSWQVRVMEEGVFEASDAALGRLWSMSTARSGSCSLPQVGEGEGDMRQFVSTASVARDMLEIVEKHGEWRQHEACRIVSEPSLIHTKESSNAMFHRLSHQPGLEKIQYWGFSYGTYLGNTFAAMFPDRVGRLVVDGVVDAYNYRKTLWSDNLIDTEKGMDMLYYHCARVGFPTCAIANERGATTPEGVRHRIANITHSLYHNPLPVIGPTAEVITFSDIKNLLFSAVYSPVQSFPYVANLLASVEKGNGTEFAELLKFYHSFSCPRKPDSGFSIIPLRNRSSSIMSNDATMAIACTDGEEQSWVNKTTFSAYAKELAEVSPTIGSMWSTLRMHCIHYSVRALHRFTGPWEGKTSHPILLIGNTADPVTPGRFAHKMAKGFEGAGVLTQNSGGHCSSSAHSNCTVGYIRRYFQTGMLPPPDTVCEVDEVPFGPGPGNGTDTLEIQLAKERHRGIHAALHEAGGGFMRLGLSGRLRDGWFE